MADPDKKPMQAVMDYLTAQRLTLVEQLDDINEGDAIAEVTGEGNPYCDLYISIARSCIPQKDEEVSAWNLRGKYAWAWVPDSSAVEPHHRITNSNKYLVNEEDLAAKTFFLITEQESHLGKIAAKIRE